MDDLTLNDYLTRTTAELIRDPRYSRHQHRVAEALMGDPCQYDPEDPYVNHEVVGPFDILDPACVTEDVEVPFKVHGRIVGTAVFHPNGIADVSVHDEAYAHLFEGFLGNISFRDFGLRVDHF